MLELKNVSKAYGSTIVLRDVSFQVRPGEFVCLTGPSGAGKSTLLNLIVGGEDASQGSIEVDGVDLKKVPRGALQLYRRKVGVVFQDYKLLPNRTVEENVAFPLEACGAPDAEINVRVPELLKQVGMNQRTKSLPHQLSGGEKTRVAIARAIVHKPIIVLADEPTGNVDPAQAMSIIQLFKDIHATGTTIILATHDSALVDALQTRVIRIEDGTIVRDSVGGYFHGHAGKREDKREERAERKAQDDDKPEGGEGKRIKVTSINS